MPAVRVRVDRTNRDALTRMFRTTGLNRMTDEAPLVALLKRLAKKLDEGGGTRDEAMYLSALKDARRVLDAAPMRSRAPARTTAKAKAPEPAEPVAAAPADPPNDLESFKAKRGIA